MWAEEVGGVCYPDDGHAACDLAGGDCSPMTADGLDNRGPHATVNDAVRLLMSFIDVDIPHDSRRCQLVDSEP
jgi:hypothetical protein